MKLEFKNVTKQYGEVNAVNKVNCVMEKVSVDFPDADTRHASFGIVVQPQFYRGDLRVLPQEFL